MRHLVARVVLALPLAIAVRPTLQPGRLVPLIGRRALLSSAAVSALGANVWSSQAAESLQGDGVQIQLTDLSAREVPCPPGFYLPAKGSWDCLEISATANNQGKRAVTAAGVFGFIRDADGYPCLSTALDDKMRTSIASLGAVPKGKSEVSFVVAVSHDAPRPLTFQGFKASYSNTAIERQFSPFDRCELDPISCALEDDDE